jgi:hypothetical protein
MKTETINLEKFELINWIAQLQDISLIMELKKLKAKSIPSVELSEFEQRIINQAHQANDAIKKGTVKSSKELREVSKKW